MMAKGKRSVNRKKSNVLATEVDPLQIQIFVDSINDILEQQKILIKKFEEVHSVLSDINVSFKKIAGSNFFS